MFRVGVASRALKQTWGKRCSSAGLARLGGTGSTTSPSPALPTSCLASRILQTSSNAISTGTYMTVRFYANIESTTKDILDGEIVGESANNKAADRTGVPLLQQRLETEHERLESTLNESLKAYGEASNSEEFVKIEEALVRVRHAYEDLQYWDQALRCEERLEMFWANNDSNDAELKQAHSWYRRGRYYMHLGLSTDASKCYQRALDAFDAYYGEDVFHPDKGSCFVSMAGIQYAHGSFEKALVILKEQSEPHLRVGDHPGLFKCLQHQGLVCRAMEDFKQALDLYEKAQSFLLTGASDSSAEEARTKLQSIQMDIADMHLVLDNLPEALGLYKTIWQDDRSFRERNDEGEVPMNGVDCVILHNLGRIYAQQNEDALAIETLRDAVDMKKAWFGPTHPEVGKSMQLLGAVYARQDRFYDALRCFEHCLAIARLQAHENDNDPDVMFALRNIALLEGEKVPRWMDKDANNDSR